MPYIVLKVLLIKIYGLHSEFASGTPDYIELDNLGNLFEFQIEIVLSGL
ncbi:19472_t:CDS:2 [Dentiscutata erythropus]|uniref:19472_t:CDS:1 n=1 Tax=Dentiscutata erythropus TaxID=1348616 RepID=A0A9N8W3F5_9GLOM|nr:19472_t:CDS:2 [Dentiscutata erythropus]